MSLKIIAFATGLTFLISCLFFALLAHQNGIIDGANRTRFKSKRNWSVLSGVLSIIFIIIGIWLPVIQASAIHCAYAKLIHIHSGPYTCESGSITIDGSTALQPLVKAVKDDYTSTSKCPSATISFGPGNGSIRGLQDVEKSYVNIGDSDVLASSQSGYNDLIDHPIAVVVYAMIVNPSVNIPGLSIDQIKGIYAGKYTDWKDLHLPPRHITAYTRDASSGSWETFTQYVISGSPDNGIPAPTATSSPTTSQSSSTNTTQDIVHAIENTPGAIGYASLADIEQDVNAGKLNIVNIDGHSPHIDMASGNYRFWNIEHMYTKSGHTSPLIDAFLSYMSDENSIGTLEKNLQFIPLSEVAGLLDRHCPT